MMNGLKPLENTEGFMSPVSPVFHSVATVNIDP